MRITFLLLIASVFFTGCNQAEQESNSKKSLRETINQYKDSLKQSEKRENARRYARKIARKAGKYKDQYPKDTMAPKYLYMLGDLHYSYLNNKDKALKNLKELRENHPDHEKAPLALFTSGFYYEQQNEKEMAEKQYKLFLKKYPNHKLAEDVRLSKKRLGMSPKEQLQNALEKRRQKDSLSQ
jgi:outer membrane protein assembly factor BamD (BamD/ComL family)